MSNRLPENRIIDDMIYKEGLAYFTDNHFTDRITYITDGIISLTGSPTMTGSPTSFHRQDHFTERITNNQT
uniref:Uncharacterized protein n=1 Tax=Rhizophagus irregularis (strain DAOM 181602 / DAOM 197198 / MUCL 43194) TaxID=747089 RepID=U9SJD3_RHIID